MSLTVLNTISPVDGRYRYQTEELANYFSEEALIRYRLFVEIEYFIALCELPLPELKSVDRSKFSDLQNICEKFTSGFAEEIKATEKITNHDVKAVEYFLKKKLDETGLSKFKEFIHFGLTSQDINNTAFPFAIKSAVEKIYLPFIADVIKTLDGLSEKWNDISMLSRTHGQPASPTRLGKEIKVFTERLNNQLTLLKQIPFSAKFGGATGNFNAHHVAYPEIDWKKFANDFA